jgi:two-component system, cell cycle response regulator DivK
MAHSLTILVVEDDADTRIVLRRYLAMLGYRVLEAENGQEALEIARLDCPDLILMDLGLPVVDGFAAARAIREVAELCKVPIVAITAYHTLGFEEAAREAGCDEYLIKPIDFDRLENTMLRLLLA